MEQKVTLSKTSLDRNQFSKVVDSSFANYVIEEESEVTVEEFFNLYEELFLSIPKEGDTNSHAYLIERSSELIDFDRTTQEFQPLLDEITTLRRQLLEERQKNINLQIEAVKQEGS